MNSKWKKLSLLIAVLGVVPSMAIDKEPRSKSYLEYIAYLGGAACSAVMGVFIAKEWSSHCSAQMA